jgi:hypothetical protein
MKSFLSWKGEFETPKNKEEVLNESLENSFSTSSNIKESFDNQQQHFRDALRNMFRPQGGSSQNYNQEPIFNSSFKQEEPTNRETEKTSKNKENQGEKIDQEDFNFIARKELDDYDEENEVSDPNIYKLYRDKEETFECNVTVEGASLSSSQARIIIDTSDVNLVFYGKIYKDGRCLVPLKKMKNLSEETRGRIRLEVIVDDTLFIPWESPCKVEGAKKVKIEIKPKKSVRAQF